MFYDFVYLAKGFRMRPKVRSTLKECSAEIAQVLAYVFNQSLTQGIVPDHWRQTNVAPIWVTG